MRIVTKTSPKEAFAPKPRLIRPASFRRSGLPLREHPARDDHATAVPLLGRAEATVKAYLYDPSDANKAPTGSP